MTRDEYKDRLYVVYNNMYQRCHNPNNPSYMKYGGRGIDIDPSWAEYPAFKAWALSNGYLDNLTLDRINNDAGYSPNNCRWATYTTQARNKGKRLGGKSKYIGVSWYPRNKKWSAGICVDGVNIYLGLFPTEEVAAATRDAYIVENAIPDFKLNFP